MAKIYEEISKSNANSGGKTDSNLANDSNHLGGIPAEQYATQKYVQDYHNNKESAQKEYIDQQDQKVLEEAKEYANSQIRNQDFSPLAKVTDVQALDEKLSKELTEGLATQKNYADQEIKKVVNDTNTNFTDVNSAISKLNSNQNNLFQSVSSGKAKVAAAITDKGVTTANDASFDTMAGNIRNIQSGTSGGSGGGEIDPNYVNTSDATATASDILLGKTAYAQGSKIYGTLIAKAGEGYPTYGTDTSGATATENDIAYGKTAYARGQLLVGTLHNTEVEEIYGINADEYQCDTQIVINKDPITSDTISNRSLITFSKNLDYCVSLTQLNDDTSTQYIESYAINENGMYIQQTSNISGDVTTKKYRYSFSELGIPSNAVIRDMKLGQEGLDNSAQRCLLGILYYIPVVTDNTTKYNLKLKLYTYHLTDNGQIGKLYDNENVIDLDESILENESYKENVQLAMFNNSPNNFYIVHCLRNGQSYNEIKIKIYSFKVLKNSSNVTTLSRTDYTDFVTGSTGYAPEGNVSVSNDDKYIYSVGSNPILIGVDTNSFAPLWIKIYASRNSTLCNIPNTSYFLSGYIDSNYNTGNPKYGDGTVSLLKLNENNSLQTVKTFALIEEYKGAFRLNVTMDNQFLIANSGTSSGSSNKEYVGIYKMQHIYDVESGNTHIVTPVEKFMLATANYYVFSNQDVSNIVFFQQEDTSHNATQRMYKLKSITDSEKLVAVKYKNKMFYSVSAETLTAGQPDVRKGKTFIGWMGYPEEGTMEV